MPSVLSCPGSNLLVITLAAYSACVALADVPGVVLMEPAGAQTETGPLVYRQIVDPHRLEALTGCLRTSPGRMALDLHERAWSVIRKRDEDVEPQPYYVAVVPGGNHADAGFRLQTEDGIEAHPETPYIKLDASRSGSEITFLHETGHVLLAILSKGEGIPTRSIASIPHSTAVLTDRGTAFNEGFAIHLETLVAHLADEPRIRRQYRHESVDFGGQSIRNSEYHRHAADLRTFSQTLGRYHDVRENHFAFASAFREPDYLRVQLDKGRDFARLRDANQLLQSEGFYASFFFLWTVRGDGVPSADTVAKRQERILTALAEMFAAETQTPDTPYLLWFVETYMRLFPDEAEPLTDALLDLSHGVFVDAEAAGLWRELYDAALRLDLRNMPTRRVRAARKRWREAVLENPKVLYSRLGPQIRCQVPQQTVTLAALGGSAPLSFDVNTVQEGVIRLIPEVTQDEVTRWLAERARQPFQSVADFKQRAGLSDAVVGRIEFE